MCGKICLSLILEINSFVLSTSSRSIPKASPSFDTPINKVPPLSFAYPIRVFAHLMGLSGFNTALYS